MGNVTATSGGASGVPGPETPHVSPQCRPSASQPQTCPSTSPLVTSLPCPHSCHPLHVPTRVRHTPPPLVSCPHPSVAMGTDTRANPDNPPPFWRERGSVGGWGAQACVHAGARVTSPHGPSNGRAVPSRGTLSDPTPGGTRVKTPPPSVPPSMVSFLPAPGTGGHFGWGVPLPCFDAGRVAGSPGPPVPGALPWHPSRHRSPSRRQRPLELGCKALAGVPGETRPPPPGCSPPGSHTRAKGSAFTGGTQSPLCAPKRLARRWGGHHLQPPCLQPLQTGLGGGGAVVLGRVQWGGPELCSRRATLCNVPPRDQGCSCPFWRFECSKSDRSWLPRPAEGRRPPQTPWTQGGFATWHPPTPFSMGRGERKGGCEQTLVGEGKRRAGGDESARRRTGRLGTPHHRRQPGHAGLPAYSHPSPQSCVFTLCGQGVVTPGRRLVG